MNRESRRNRRKLVEIWKFRPAWMRVVAGLAAVVMFVTVYSLILPAAAATGDQATEESGFFLEESAAETETKELAEAEPASRSATSFPNSCSMSSRPPSSRTFPVGAVT